MAANLTLHAPIASVQSTVDNGPFTVSLPEQAGQVFFQGVPVQLNAGFVRLWDGATISAGILGFSLIPASNLPTSGQGAPGFFGQIGAPGATQTYGSVPNEPSASNIAIGAPMTDGRTLLESAYGSTIFEAQFDNSAGAVAADYTPTPATIGQQYGLTVDPNGYWYVDKNKNTPGTNTVLTVVSINPIDLLPGSTGLVYIPNARVRFTILASARQLY